MQYKRSDGYHNNQIKDMIGGQTGVVGGNPSCGLPCPNLLRNVTIENKSDAEVQVTSVHGSGQTVKTTVAAGEKKLIEREVNHGTWTSFDNITDFVVRRTNHPDEQILTFKGTQAHGIDCRIYTIQPNFTAQRVLVHHE